MATASTLPTYPSPSNDSAPVHYGIILYPAFQALDVFGPLDILNLLAQKRHLKLSVISSMPDVTIPVSTQPRVMNPFNSTMFESVVPTHSISNPPKDLDVLIVPGGLGVRAPDLNATVDYIRDVYPSLKYLMSVCTGAGLLARAGILDGRRATTNKAAYKSLTPEFPKTNWQSHARWVVDGNVWTSSGISAGIDCMFGFVAKIYGEESAKNVSQMMEYKIQGGDDGTNDEFAAIYGL